MKKVRYPPEISRPVILVRSKGFAVPDPNALQGKKQIQEANEEMMRLNVYARNDLSLQDQIKAARELT
jgi:hypothetical protein